MTLSHVLLYVLMFGMLLYADAFISFFDLKVKFDFTLDESHTLVTQAPMSFEQCHDACLARKKCLAIEFRRLFRLCRLLSSDSNTAGVQTVFQKGTVYSEKSDWPKKYPETGCEDCKMEETCLTNANAVTCKQSECAKPELLDAQSMILGNEVSVGSRILHKCKYMTNISAESVCETKGHWSKQAFKCPLDLDGKMFKIISSQNNMWWHFNGEGDKRVSSTDQVDDAFVKFHILKQTDGFYKITCFGYAADIYDGYGLAGGSNFMRVLQYVKPVPDEDSLLYNVTIESENYYRIQTKATGRYVRLDPDGYVSTRYNLKDESSLFLFEEVS